MAKQDIDRGSLPGDGTGEDLYVTFGKCINNYDDLYQFDANLGLDTTGNGASMIAIEDSATNFTATDVEGALVELESETATAQSTADGAVTDAAAIVTNLASAANGDGAALVGVEDSAGNFDGATVEAVLAELSGSTALAPAMESSIRIEYEFAGVVSLLPTNSGAVRIHAFGDCFIEFGDSSVTTTISSIYFAAGTEMFGVPTGATHIAVKSAGEPGALNVVGLDTDVGEELTTNEMIEVTAGSSSVALPDGGKSRLFAITDCFINFGDSNVSADETSMFFEAGTELISRPSAATHIAARRYVSDGGLYISGVN